MDSYELLLKMHLKHLFLNLLSFHRSINQESVTFGFLNPYIFLPEMVRVKLTQGVFYNKTCPALSIGFFGRLFRDRLLLSVLPLN